MNNIEELELDFKEWEKYRNVRLSITKIDSLARYLRLEEERTELAKLYQKLKVIPWTSKDVVSNDEALRFHERLQDWRNKLIMEILSNGSV